MEKKEKKKEWKDFEFNLFGTDWYVHFTNETITDKTRKGSDEQGFYFGINYADRRVIEVALLNVDGNPLCDSEICNTLVHEIVHAIYSTGCYENTNNDEPLVEWTAKCIISLIKQGELVECVENIK